MKQLLRKCDRTVKKFHYISTRPTDVKMTLATAKKFVHLGIGVTSQNLRSQELICSCINIGICQKRTFINFNNFSNKKKEYSGRQLVGFSMEQMYTVVSDVGNYHNFVPWCKKSIILKKRPDHLKADLVIGFPPINERYTSSVTLVRPHLVKAECTEGRLFNHLLTLWRFSPGLKRESQSCVVDFRTTFEFRSTLHSQLSHLFFDQVVRQMENAFLKEVERRYGTPKIQPQNLLFDPHNTM